MHFTVIRTASTPKDEKVTLGLCSEGIVRYVYAINDNDELSETKVRVVIPAGEEESAKIPCRHAFSACIHEDQKRSYSSGTQRLLRSAPFVQKLVTQECGFRWSSPYPRSGSTICNIGLVNDASAY